MLNVSKCVHVSVSRQKSIIGLGYTVNGQIIEKSQLLEIIILNSKLIFDQIRSLKMQCIIHSERWISLLGSQCFHSLKSP